MNRTNLFLKVEIEHDARDSPQRMGEDICRQILKMYGVESAELTSFTSIDD